MSTNFSNDYDPGKAAYLRNPNFQAAPMSQISRVDPRLCPACIFPYSRVKSLHVEDCRCSVWLQAHQEHEHVATCPSRVLPQTLDVRPVERPQKVGMRIAPAVRDCEQLERDIQKGTYR